MKPRRKSSRRATNRSALRRTRLSGSSLRKSGKRRRLPSAFRRLRFAWPKPPFSVPRRSAAAIVPVMGEEGTIGAVLQELKRLPLNEMIFVVNGSDDRTFPILREQSDAVIVHYPYALGHDVGRAIGAKLAKSEILLFVDGDMPIPAEQLMPFIEAVDGGIDVALNDVTSFLGNFSARDGVSMVKEFVNRILNRPDLKANSLTAVPHAMSKAAAEAIGYDKLAVPPKAQAVALELGLRVGVPVGVDVVKRNRLRPINSEPNNPVAELIIGDHIEALAEVMAKRGPRLNYPDLIRKRFTEETQ